MGCLVVAAACAVVTDEDTQTYPQFSELRTWCRLMKPDQATYNLLDGVPFESEHLGQATPSGTIMEGITFTVRGRCSYLNGADRVDVRPAIEHPLEFNMMESQAKDTDEFRVDSTGNVTVPQGNHTAHATVILFKSDDVTPIVESDAPFSFTVN